MANNTPGVPAHHIAGRNFIMLHLDLVDDLDGDFLAALLLDRIKFKAGEGWLTATYDELMADTRMTHHQVKRCLRKLREAGYIESKRVSPYDPTQMFRVVVCEECAENTETTVKSKTARTRSEESPTVRVENARTSGRESPALPSSKNVEELSKTFDHFRAAYPMDVDMFRARKAWNEIPPNQRDNVVAGAQRFRRWCQQTQQDPKFIPSPVTWLHGERWNDVLDVPLERAASVVPLEVPKWIQDLDGPEHDAAYLAFIKGECTECG